jgi:hypothetical protein
VSPAAATTIDLEIWVDGQDEPIAVRADQRDMAAFEVEYKMGTSRAMEDMQMVFFRFLGWHAARRIGKIPKDVKRDEWLDTVIEVTPAEDDDEEVLQGADPTSPAA